MSGGSYDYICYKLSNECEGRMYDAEMNDLIKDLCEVLHSLEWWQSGDTSESSYREELSRFKAKWFKGDRQERLKGYIDEQIGIVRSQLYSLIGEPQESEITMQRLISESRLQETLALIPMEERTFRKAVETAEEAETVMTIPNNPTNRDMLIALYPNLRYTIQNNRVVTTIGVAASFDLDWWNTPYKRGE